MTSSRIYSKNTVNKNDAFINISFVDIGRGTNVRVIWNVRKRYNRLPRGITYEQRHRYG